MKKALLIIILIIACKRKDIIPNHDSLTHKESIVYMFKGKVDKP